MIAWIDGSSVLEAARAGGKASSLARLAGVGLPVPPGFVVTTDAYWLFHREAGLQAHVEALRALEGRPQFAAVREASAPLLAALEAAVLPATLTDAITAAYEQLEEQAGAGSSFAVRSSAASEDGIHASFAGLYESYLNLSAAEAVCEAVLRCYRCLWEPRATQYRTMKGLDHANEAMAVVVMETVASATSGVVFTMNPVTGATDELLVNASWGLGEAIVSGLVNPDSWRLSRSGAVLAEAIEEKTVESVVVEGGTAQREVSGARAKQASLSPAQLAEVAKAAVTVEQLYGGAVDIEFAFDAAGRFYLLQARPVTTS